MPVPSYADLVNPLLQAFHSSGGTATVAQLEEVVAQILGLSIADIVEIHRGSRTKLSYSLAWARNYLKRLGLIVSTERGVWSLTAQGLRRKFVEASEVQMLDSQSEPLEGWDGSIVDDLGNYPIDSVLIRQEARTVFETVRRIGSDKFILDPDFQRDFIWDLDKQSKLIESLLLRIPLPVVYLAERDDGKTVVVDGLQRLTTFKRYLGNEFPLRNLVFASEFNDAYFADLPPKLQNRIEDSNLILYLIDAKVPEQAKLDIFERVNGGVPLSRQQMRNCIYTGPATRWLRTEANSEEFLVSTGHSLSRSSMRDRECINRFCAFQLLTEQNYSGGDMDRFLAQGLLFMNRISEKELLGLSENFRRSMLNNFNIFGRQAFRKHTSPNQRRSVINVALFDVYSVILGNISIENGRAMAEKIRELFYRLIEDEVFNEAISISTNATSKVRTRFELARETFKGII